MSKAVQEAVATVRDALAEVHSVVTSEYPVGADIAWEQTGRECQGVVTVQGCDGRLKVLNTLSGREYWINPEKII